MLKVYHLHERHARDAYFVTPADFELFWAAGGYTLVAEVDTDNLEVAFEKTNTIDRYWPQNDGVRVFGSRLRSTSVGDIVKDAAGQHHLCASMGWTPINVR